MSPNKSASLLFVASLIPLTSRRTSSSAIASCDCKLLISSSFFSSLVIKVSEMSRTASFVCSDELSSAAVTQVFASVTGMTALPPSSTPAPLPLSSEVVLVMVATAVAWPAALAASAAAVAAAAERDSIPPNSPPG